jgi:hypothetical protein
VDAKVEYHQDYAIVTHDDDPETRYIAMQDTDAESPVHWGWFDVYVYSASYGGSTDEGRADESMIARAFFTRYALDHDAEDALSFARRWATIYEGYTPEQATLSIATYSARGYSQSDWWDVLVITDDRDTDARGCAETWEQWARGDVWFVYPERRLECDHEHEHWDREPFFYAGLGGIYADDAESAVSQYVELS